MENLNNDELNWDRVYTIYIKYENAVKALFNLLIKKNEYIQNGDIDNFLLIDDREIYQEMLKRKNECRRYDNFISRKECFLNYNKLKLLSQISLSTTNLLNQCSQLYKEMIILYFGDIPDIAAPYDIFSLN